jgi:DNA transposition AAA+ family ATPase
MVLEPEHFLNVTGANILETPTLQAVAQDLDFIIEHHAIGVVHGPAGLGKTFAVDAALSELIATQRGSAGRRRFVSLSFTHAPTMREVANTLATALLPVPPTSGNRFELQTKVLRELSTAPHLLIVDEAQRLTRHAMEVLRYIYDDKTIKLAVLLVGGDGCWETISREPMIKSRVARKRRFLRLPEREVPALMQLYHPLYAKAAPELLAQVDAGFAHGNWRSWASFTATAFDLATTHGRTTLDDDLVTTSYVSLGRGD